MGAARIIPYVVLSVPAGIIVDRYDRRLVLLLTDIARGLIMVALTALVLAGSGLLPIVGLAIFATCFSTFFRPAIGAYVPQLVRDERELGPANSLFATLGELTFVIGPALAGVIIAVTNLAWAFAINAATFAFVAVVLATLPAGLPGKKAVAGGSSAGDAPETDETEHPKGAEAATMSLRAVARPLAGIVTLDTVSGFMFGGLSVLTVLLAVDRLNAGEAATGYLNAAVGVGGVVGAISVGAVIMRRSLAPVLLGGALAMGAGFILLGFVTTLPPALLAMAVIAAGALISDVVDTTVFQRVVADEMRGRVLGGMQSLQTFTYALGALLMPVLVTYVGAWIILPLGGIAIMLAAVAAVWLLGSNLRKRPRSPASTCSSGSRGSRSCPARRRPPSRWRRRARSRFRSRPAPWSSARATRPTASTSSSQARLPWTKRTNRGTRVGCGSWARTRSSGSWAS